MGPILKRNMFVVANVNPTVCPYAYTEIRRRWCQQRPSLWWSTTAVLSYRDVGIHRFCAQQRVQRAIGGRATQARQKQRGDRAAHREQVGQKKQILKFKGSPKLNITKKF